MQPFFAHIFCYRGTLAIWKPVAFMCTKRSGSNRALEVQVLKCGAGTGGFPNVVSMFYEDGWYKYIVRNYDLFLKTCNKFNISAFWHITAKIDGTALMRWFFQKPLEGGLRLRKVRWSCFRLGNFHANTLPETNSSHLKKGHSKRKRSYSNHPFLGASGRVTVSYISFPSNHILNLSDSTANRSHQKKMNWTSPQPQPLKDLKVLVYLVFGLKRTLPKTVLLMLIDHEHKSSQIKYH